MPRQAGSCRSCRTLGRIPHCEGYNVMESNRSNPTPRSAIESTTVELYKTAFARLNFQDEYLFKFTAVFLTAHGALAILAGSAYFRTPEPSRTALILLAILGIALAIVWWTWTRHNDYWHAVWTGVLRDIERNHLSTSARVFDREHAQLVSGLNRRFPSSSPGHRIAQWFPLTVASGWAITLFVSCAAKP